MRINKVVFWISLISFASSILFICIFTPLKNFNVCFEVLLNIFISLVGGAFLSGVLAYTNYISIKFQNERDFITNSIAWLNLILDIARWYSEKGTKVNYNVNYNGVEDNDFEEKSKRKNKVMLKNKPLIEDFYNVIKRVGEFDLTLLYNITDDYSNSIWSHSKFSNQKKLNMMLDIEQAFQNYNYMQYDKINHAFTLYETSQIGEYAFYSEVSPHFASLIEEKKHEELRKKLDGFIQLTKINNKINKVYNRNRALPK